MKNRRPNIQRFWWIDGPHSTIISCCFQTAGLDFFACTFFLLLLFIYIHLGGRWVPTGEYWHIGYAQVLCIVDYIIYSGFRTFRICWKFKQKSIFLVIFFVAKRIYCITFFGWEIRISNGIYVESLFLFSKQSCFNSILSRYWIVNVRCVESINCVRTRK